MSHGQLTNEGWQTLPTDPTKKNAPPQKYERYVWRPDKKLTQNLPPNFEIAIARCQDDAGRRRWYLEDLLTQRTNVTAAIGNCFLGGLEIVRAIKNLNDKQLFSYRLMWILFSFRERFQEYYDRRFRYSSDLFIKFRGRDQSVSNGGNRTVLSVLKHNLSITKLLSEGREVAKSRGQTNAPKEKLIQYGLWKIASNNPLRLTKKNIPGVVRRALFRLELTDAEIGTILEDSMVPRVLKAIEDHKDASDEDFRNWFRGEISHKFSHLANQKKPEGGRLDPAYAKQVALALLWRAHTYVGDCFHIQMRTIQKAIGPQLSTEEAELFERMYLRQPVFANLPWLLIQQRSDIIAAELFDWMDDPSKNIDEPVVHRLLSYYANVAEERRATDNRSKQVGRDPLIFSLDAEWDSANTSQGVLAPPDENLFVLLETHCPCCFSAADLHAVDLTENDDGTFTFDACCDKCDKPMSHNCTRTQLSEIFGS